MTVHKIIRKYYDNKSIIEVKPYYENGQLESHNFIIRTLYTSRPCNESKRYTDDGKII